MKLRDWNGWTLAAGLFSPTAVSASVPSQPARFFLLDAARAFAAFAVLFWHYQHFFIPINGRVADDPFSREPLHGLFGLLYDHGDIAVPIFWMISGFVFSRVYLSTTANTGSFVLNRLARLYPLHILTLIVVLILQMVSLAKFGDTQIFGNNDIYHFILQIFFASSWGFENGNSFNAPIWSVSVEILIYAVFWLVHGRLVRFGALLPLAWAAIFLLSAALIRGNTIGQCGYYFFIGSALYIFFSALYHASRVLISSACGMIAFGAAALWFAHADPAIKTLGISGLFGGLILLLVLAESYVPQRARKTLAVVGDNTYGMYLWHVPIQLVLFLIFGAGIAKVAEAPAFLFVFLLLVIIAARVSFVLFERPMRDWLRDLGNRRPAEARAGAS